MYEKASILVIKAAPFAIAKTIGLNRWKSVEIEWVISRGSGSLAEIFNIREVKCESERSQGKIIFISKCNDTEWRKQEK